MPHPLSEPVVALAASSVLAPTVNYIGARGFVFVRYDIHPVLRTVRYA